MIVWEICDEKQVRRFNYVVVLVPCLVKRRNLDSLYGSAKRMSFLTAT